MRTSAGRCCGALLGAPLLLAAPHPNKNLTGDAILNNLLDKVLEDVPETRFGMSRTQWVMTGSVSESWSYYSSTSGASFGGGFSEFYGAGGATSIYGPDGIVRTRYNSLYPGFGSTGEWMMQPKQERKIQYQLMFVHSVINVNILMSQLWASVILRDNLVTVFGYVINRPDNPLSTELYTSLYHIYDAVRLRRVQTFEVIKVLKDVSYGTPTQQFLYIFQGLKKVVPRYLNSAVQIWIDSLELQDVPLDEILRPNGGPLVVDFLAGIESSVLHVLNEHIKWNPFKPRGSNPAVSELMGPIFVDIFAALEDGSLALTQPLFGAILMNRPIDEVIAERDETERYLVDVLRLGNVEPWHMIIKPITRRERGNPEILIKSVLTQISISLGTDALIREDARYLIPYLKPPSKTYANKYYTIVSPVLSTPSIDLMLLLRSITMGEYPTEIVEDKDRIVHFIRNGHLDIEFIIKGFNRFDHISPVNVLIALLTRIQRRLPKLPQEIISSVKSLQLFLIYKKFLCSMSPRVPLALLDISSLINAFSNLRIPAYIYELIQKLVITLPDEDVPWRNLVQEVSLDQCIRPRKCIINFFKLVIERKYITRGPSLDIMVLLITLLDDEGNPKQEYVSTSPRYHTTPHYETSSMRIYQTEQTYPGGGKVTPYGIYPQSTSSERPPGAEVQSTTPRLPYPQEEVGTTNNPDRIGATDSDEITTAYYSTTTKRRRNKTGKQDEDRDETSSKPFTTTVTEDTTNTAEDLKGTTRHAEVVSTQDRETTASEVIQTETPSATTSSAATGQTETPPQTTTIIKTTTARSGATDSEEITTNVVTEQTYETTTQTKPVTTTSLPATTKSRLATITGIRITSEAADVTETPTLTTTGSEEMCTETATTEIQSTTSESPQTTTTTTETVTAPTIHNQNMEHSSKKTETAVTEETTTTTQEHTSTTTLTNNPTISRQTKSTDIEITTLPHVITSPSETVTTDNYTDATVKIVNDDYMTTKKPAIEVQSTVTETPPYLRITSHKPNLSASTSDTTETPYLRITSHKPNLSASTSDTTETPYVRTTSHKPNISASTSDTTETPPYLRITSHKPNISGSMSDTTETPYLRITSHKPNLSASTSDITETPPYLGITSHKPNISASTSDKTETPYLGITSHKPNISASTSDTTETPYLRITSHKPNLSASTSDTTETPPYLRITSHKPNLSLVTSTTTESPSKIQISSTKPDLTGFVSTTTITPPRGISFNYSLEIILNQSIIFAPEKEIPGRFHFHTTPSPADVEEAKFPPIDYVHEKEPASITNPATCLTTTQPGTIEDYKLKPIRAILSIPDLYSYLGADFNPANYSTKGELLLAILERFVGLQVVQQNRNIHIYINNYISFIHQSQQSQGPSVTINFSSLLNALPFSTSELEVKYITKITNFISTSEFYKILGPSFNPSLYKTRGMMLKYVFEILITLQSVRSDSLLYEALMYFMDRIYMNGYGGQAVEWVLIRETCEVQSVDVRSVFRAINHDKLSKAGLQAESNILNFIFNEFIPSVHFNTFNLSMYKTKGQLLHGAFKYLLNQNTVNPRIKSDILILLPYIRFEGPGVEPVDYDPYSR